MHLCHFCVCCAGRIVFSEFCFDCSVDFLDLLFDLFFLVLTKLPWLVVLQFPLANIPCRGQSKTYQMRLGFCLEKLRRSFQIPMPLYHLHPVSVIPVPA